ncbi:MAG: hypothetical protein J6V11_04215, partial [Alphaproteobacteria bacterium]|nr:hypothetical protein [Alphaproteobacteria bacterium]
RGSVVTGDTGKVSSGGEAFPSGVSLIPCRFLWAYHFFAFFLTFSLNLPSNTVFSENLNYFGFSYDSL